MTTTTNIPEQKMVQDETMVNASKKIAVMVAEGKTGEIKVNKTEEVSGDEKEIKVEKTETLDEDEKETKADKTEEVPAGEKEIKVENVEASAEDEKNDKETMSTIESNEPSTTAETSIFGDNGLSDADKDIFKIEAEKMSQLAHQASMTGQYDVAVEQFGAALEILVGVYGQLGKECAELYLCYGKALLNLAISQNGILGESAEKNAANMESAVAMVVESAEKEKAAGPSKILHFGDDNEPEEEEGEEEQDAIESAGAGEEKSDDFETAWEVLDVARVIYGRSFDMKSQAKLADVYLLLGDISLETENFKQASIDYKEGLRIRKIALDENDRLIAEAHYKSAMALDYAGEAIEAMAELKDAIRLLKDRCKALEADITQEESGKGKEKAISNSATSSVEDKKREIEDLKNLFPDMESKLKEMRAEMAKKATEEKKPAVNSAVEGEMGQALLRLLTGGTGESSSDSKTALMDLMAAAAAGTEKKDEGSGSSTSSKTAFTPSAFAPSVFAAASGTTTTNDLTGLVRKKAEDPTEKANTEDLPMKKKARFSEETSKE